LRTMGLPTKAEAVAYMQSQDLQSLLAIAVNQAVVEKAPDAAKRVGELLLKAAHDRENMQRMKELFASADTNRSGAIDIDELRTFTVKIGEPLDEPGLQKAFESMGGPNGGITFDAFASWYQGARAKGGELSRKGEAYTKRASRASRQSRASHEATDDNAGAASNFNIRACTIRETGEPKTLQYRVGLHYPDGGGNLAPISPWHDVPLYPAAAAPGEVHMIVEIPKWSRAKFEIATGEDYNPIKQDTKKGRLREYTYGDMLFNYGCFPQTWEDPAHTTPDTNAIGDNDPVDAMEIGTMIHPVGSIVRVKVLGCLAMIDDGETDWKVICISMDDPLAKQMDDINDVERVIPGLTSVMREWLRMYKTVDGKPENTFGLEERAMDKAYTMAVVEETHQFWQNLINQGRKTV